jgi:hypothetical protein
MKNTTQVIAVPGEFTQKNSEGLQKNKRQQENKSLEAV